MVIEETHATTPPTLKARKRKKFISATPARKGTKVPDDGTNLA